MLPQDCWAITYKAQSKLAELKHCSYRSLILLLALGYTTDSFYISTGNQLRFTSCPKWLMKRASNKLMNSKSPRHSAVIVFLEVLTFSYRWPWRGIMSSPSNGGWCKCKNEENSDKFGRSFHCQPDTFATFIGGKLLFFYENLRAPT